MYRFYNAALVLSETALVLSENVLVLSETALVLVLSETALVLVLEIDTSLSWCNCSFNTRPTCECN